MAWTQTDPKDGKPRFLKKEGQNIILTKEKRGNLLDEIPGGWDVIEKNKRLRLIRRK